VERRQLRKRSLLLQAGDDERRSGEENDFVALMLLDVNAVVIVDGK
jgi:hypothetical protein